MNCFRGKFDFVCLTNTRRRRRSLTFFKVLLSDLLFPVCVVPELLPFSCFPPSQPPPLKGGKGELNAHPSCLTIIYNNNCNGKAAFLNEKHAQSREWLPFQAASSLSSPCSTRSPFAPAKRSMQNKRSTLNPYFLFNHSSLLFAGELQHRVLSPTQRASPHSSALSNKVGKEGPVRGKGEGRVLLMTVGTISFNLTQRGY